MKEFMQPGRQMQTRTNKRNINQIGEVDVQRNKYINTRP